MTGLSDADIDIGHQLLNIVEKKEAPRTETGRFDSKPTPQEIEPGEVEEQAEEAAPEVEAPEVEEEEIASPDDTEPEAPAIDPPAGLTADETDVFRNSPPEVQKAWARREQERQREFRKWQNERADHAKAQAEAVKALENERQQLAARLNEYVSDVEAEFQKKFGSVKDPTELLAEPMKLLEYQALIAKIGQGRQQKQMLDQQQAQERESAIANFRQEQNAKLVEMIPSLSDPAKAQAFERDVVKFLTDQGVAPEAIRRTSAVELALVHDAMKWRQAKAKREAAEKTQKPVPKVMRPGAKPDTSPAVERQKQAMSNLKKSGKVEDAAAYFKNIL